MLLGVVQIDRGSLLMVDDLMLTWLFFFLERLDEIFTFLFCIFDALN
jgi:hypothetical protein